MDYGRFTGTLSVRARPAPRFRLALRLAEPWIGSGKVEVPIVVARAVGVELNIGFENLAA